MDADERRRRILADRYGDMVPVASDQMRGRLYECPCGARVWSCWGNATKHARSCPRSGRVPFGR